MKITIYCIGKLKENYWKDACAEYLKRLKPYADTSIVELPDYPCKQNASEAEITAVKEKEADLNGKRILVVEDNDINREIAEAVLQKRGIITETAVNGQEAVEMFSSHVPGYYDLILMDIRMPIMGGLTATKRIRSMERDDAETIPIVAMTANAFSKDVEASLDAGMDAHLSKPIEPNLLYSTISKFVS